MSRSLGVSRNTPRLAAWQCVGFALAFLCFLGSIARAAEPPAPTGKPGSLYLRSESGSSVFYDGFLLAKPTGPLTVIVSPLPKDEKAVTVVIRQDETEREISAALYANPGSPALVPLSAGSTTFRVTIPPSFLPRGSQLIEVVTGDSHSNKMAVAITYSPQWVVYVLAIVSTILVGALVLCVIWPLFKHIALSVRFGKLIRSLLLEGDSGCYSLSRFQFYVWSSIGVFAFIYLFWTGVLVHDRIELPDIANLYALILASAGTSIGAAAVTVVKGPKGAGEFEPSVADLVTSGGLVSVDRLQYFVWTVVVAITYLLVLLFKSQATLVAAPAIPTEILALFGASSVGYLGGKAARKPGPIIDSGALTTGKVGDADVQRVTLRGHNLSMKATVFINGEEQVVAASGSVPVAKHAIVELPAAMAPKESEYFDSLVVTLPQGAIGATTSIKLVNPDGQFAEWKTS